MEVCRAAAEGPLKLVHYKFVASILLGHIHCLQINLMAQTNHRKAAKRRLFYLTFYMSSKYRRKCWNFLRLLGERFLQSISTPIFICIPLHSSLFFFLPLVCRQLNAVGKILASGLFHLKKMNS